MSRKQKQQRQQGLGKALKNKLEKKRWVGSGQSAPIFYQQTEENQSEKLKVKMQSVLEQSSLADFLQEAQLSQKDFHANREIRLKEIHEEMKNKKIISIDNKAHIVEEIRAKMDYNQLLKGIQVPRRPKWQTITNKDALEKAQNQAYLEWRRTLAKVEQTHDNLTITPYQKNLQVWRQLWRVVERSSVLLQIVDGRHPLFFFSPDLISYAQSLGKTKFLIIINKSDLLEPQAITKWNSYFKTQGIDHIFFTACEAQLKESQQPEQQKTQKQQTNEEYMQEGIPKEKVQNQQKQAVAEKEEIKVNSQRILSPQQLISVLEKYVEAKEIQVGLVGYPNVGKSSVINALLGRKKVGVASMPGKTKHFQTLRLTQQIILCDCPGLVFPKISETKAEMLLNGLYPVDTFKEYHSAVELLAYRIPQAVVSKQYGIHWKPEEPYDADSILNKSAIIRGFMTGNGLPNQALTARNILKDYVNGVIVYCHLPPGSQDGKLTFAEQQAQINLAKANFIKKVQNTQHNLDTQFFEKQQVGATAQEIVSLLGQDDFLDIIEGRKLEGFKVTKDMRKEIKFALKRGANQEQLRGILLGNTGKQNITLIKN